MSELHELAERAGYENLREHIENAGMIRREANTVMALLLTGAGAALAYAGGDGARGSLIGASLGVSIYLFAMAAALNMKCLGLVAYPSLYNEPKNLFRSDYSTVQVRQWELDNLQSRIDEAAAINARRSRWLNRCRYAAALTPLAAAIGWVSADLVAGVVRAAAVAVAG